MAQAHSFLYPSSRRDYTRSVDLASPRDSEANTQLRIAAHGLGYEFGESILNFPPRQCGFELLPEARLAQVELPFVRRGDVFIKTTRPPLSDGEHGDNKKIEPSNTNIERAIFRHYWRYFRVCCRSYVELTEEAARYLPLEKKNRAAMTFYQQSSRYMFLQARDGRRSPRKPLGARTAAFLLRVDEIWPDGPGLIAAWGLNGLSTLALCSLLRYRFPWMLESRGLSMVELEPGSTPERPSTVEWMRDWRMTRVFEMEKELPPRTDESWLGSSFQSGS